MDLQMALKLKLMPWKPFCDEAPHKRSMAQQWRSWDILRQEIEKLGHYNCFA
jgi:hypothetical protein